MSQGDDNNKRGYAGWKRFRNRGFAVLGIFVLIILYATFYFVGPVNGTVIDAKTGNPIPNIKVRYTVYGSSLCFSPGGCTGWAKSKEAYTDDKGKFKISFSIEKRFPFFEWLDYKNKIYINEHRNENYDDYEQDVIWPFNLNFKLVPIPKTLDDCRENLTKEEQYRCASLLARSTRISNTYLSELYFTDKYAHALNRYCDEQLHADYTLEECRAVLAVEKKDKNICLLAKEYKYGYGGWDYCIFIAAIDLQDKTWCNELPTGEEVFSKENCEKIIKKNN